MVVQLEEVTGRGRVLDAAAKLFVQQGYAGTTLRQIAAAAGIKAGSIYHHFDSKDALFIAVLNDGILVMLDAFDQADLATDSTPHEIDARIQEHVQAHLRAVFENGPYTTAHVTAFASAPISVRSAVVPQRDSYEARWNLLFEQLFPQVDHHELRLQRLMLFGVMNGTVEWFDADGNLSIEQLATSISQQFLHGVT